MQFQCIVSDYHYPWGCPAPAITASPGYLNNSPNRIEPAAAVVLNWTQRQCPVTGLAERKSSPIAAELNSKVV